MVIRTRNIELAKIEHPGGYIYIRVKGGFLVFDWPSEYAAWKHSR